MDAPTIEVVVTEVDCVVVGVGVLLMIKDEPVEAGEFEVVDKAEVDEEEELSAD